MARGRRGRRRQRDRLARAGPRGERRRGALDRGRGQLGQARARAAGSRPRDVDQRSVGPRAAVGGWSGCTCDRGRSAGPRRGRRARARHRGPPGATRGHVHRRRLRSHLEASRGHRHAHAARLTARGAERARCRRARRLRRAHPRGHGPLPRAARAATVPVRSRRGLPVAGWARLPAVAVHRDGARVRRPARGRAAHRGVDRDDAQRAARPRRHRGRERAAARQADAARAGRARPRAERRRHARARLVQAARRQPRAARAPAVDAARRGDRAHGDRVGRGAGDGARVAPRQHARRHRERLPGDGAQEDVLARHDPPRPRGRADRHRRSDGPHALRALRLPPRRGLPDPGRPAQPHGRRDRVRQGARRRHPRGQAHADAHPPPGTGDGG